MFYTDEGQSYLIYPKAILQYYMTLYLYDHMFILGPDEI
jgi:hypothetical protein